VLSLLAFVSLGAAASGNSSMETLRWTEGKPGCTFSADDDGKYRYGLWSEDLGVVMAVDADEIRKAGLRVEPLFAVPLTIRYRGQDSVAIHPGKISMEFVSHYRTLQTAVDPDEVANRMEHDSDASQAEMEKEISKHPEKRAAQEALIQDHQKNVRETAEFVRSHCLREVRLDRDHPEASGWVFFSTKSKWIGNWKKQEQLVLRVPIEDRVIEFPFALPPSAGDLLLRKR
jgi:hypothetical protein